jgi:hypothetical protein
MVIPIPTLIVIVLIVLLVVAVVGRTEPRPKMTPTKMFWILAAVCFALACLGVAYLPWIPLGLFCYVMGYLVSPA